MELLNTGFLNSVPAKDGVLWQGTVLKESESQAL